MTNNSMLSYRKRLTKMKRSKNTFLLTLNVPNLYSKELTSVVEDDLTEQTIMMVLGLITKMPFSGTLSIMMLSARTPKCGFVHFMAHMSLIHLPKLV